MEDSSKTIETHLSPDRSPTDKLLGMTFDDRYLIERELGHGGMGVVYLARDHKLHDKPVVVKVLLEKSLRNEWLVLKFQQEKEALTRVDHPGVVLILDAGKLPGGELYIVMQYVDGVALRDAIKAHPQGLDLERAAAIIKQAGAALSAVHEKKIFHRDLKPENIMLHPLGRGAEQVKIVDFGIAKIRESVIAPSTVTGAATAGTVAYMAPEQLRGGKVSAASDIYSFGVIAYEMVTGRRPFNPDTVAHLSDMQREGVRAKPIDLRPRLSEEAQAIILRALAFEAKARYQNAGEFGDALSQALMNEEETVRQYQPEISQLPTRKFDPTSSASQPGGQHARTLVTSFEPAQVHKQGQPVLSPIKHAVRERRWLKFAVVLVVAAALALGAYFLITKRQSLVGGDSTTGPNSPILQRSLVYSLTVQKMREGKRYEQPFASSGQEIFENGYKFQLNVSSPQPGYLYVFNEGADEKTGMSFTIVYPTPATNKGSAQLDTNQKMQTNWNTFAGGAGTEEMWIVWSASPVAQMEAARDAAFRNSEGAVTDAAMIRTVKEFLTKHSDPKPETTKDTVKKQTDVHVNGELLVKLVQLEHR
jgi:serine/threonine protein kinase